MKLTISNVGRINRQTTIEMNGITVLAGVNGVGKSTIGKVLFCLFDTFYDYENQISRERILTIKRQLRFNSSLGAGARRRITDEDILELIELVEEGHTENKIENWIASHLNDSDEKIDVLEIKESLLRTLKTSDDVVLTALLANRLMAEFNTQIRHLNYPAIPTDVDLAIKDNHIRFHINPSNQLEILSRLNLNKSIIYIDDPNILDDLEEGFRISRYSHKYNLVRKLKDNYKTENSVIDRVIIDERIDEIEKQFQKVRLGEMTYTNDRGYQYTDPDLKENVSIENVSMGLKSYIIIKELLQKGLIEDNGILILDEPEIHLHPEWMKIFAELIVLIQKEFNLNILISTHSADFLEFIELYSCIHKCEEKCKYYLLKEEDDNRVFTEVNDVTENVDLIYDMLGKPFIDASEELSKINGFAGD